MSERIDVPIERVRVLNDQPVRGDGRYVLYWMIATRRTGWNFGLQHAAALAREQGLPLVVLEALRCDYRWKSDRLHAFVLQGMRDNAAALASQPVTYYPFVERELGEGKGLLASLANEAAVVVTDDYPCFFHPRMVAAAAEQLPVRLVSVDSNGLLPMRSVPRVFARAFDFRRFLQRNLDLHLPHAPLEDPLAGLELPELKRLPAGIAKRWPRATSTMLAAAPRFLASLPIDHEVGAVRMTGGARAGEAVVERFVSDRLARYEQDRNQPEAEATSGLSAYLHFGHVSPHQVLQRLAEPEEWLLQDLGSTRNGGREGWWGMSPAAEAFLDQLVTWRELGFNMAAQREDLDRFESLPDWARKTLREHEQDERPHLYELDAFEQAQTHDTLWNAAQNELRATGVMHNYLRMLWGKKILHWSATPREALAIMIELNNKYALDGRDPNSYSGIFWVLGRYDRAWGPEREVFGKIRYMSSDNTRRKLRVKAYVERWGSGSLFDSTKEDALA